MLVPAPGQVGSGFARQGDESPQVIHAHFGGVAGIGYGALGQGRVSPGALAGQQGPGLGVVGHGHYEGVVPISGHSIGQQPAVLGGQSSGGHAHGLRLLGQALARCGRKLAQPRWVWVEAAGRFVGHFLRQEH